MKNRLIGAFILTSMIPFLFVNIFSYYNSSKLIKKNVNELIMVNLQKTKNSLDILLDSYYDFIYQIYTDDEIVELVDKINLGEDVAFSRYRLRKMLRNLFYSKEYVQSITIISGSGDVVFYDKLTSSNLSNSWMDNYSLSKKELYDEISMDNSVHIYSTQHATTFASGTYYLFHIGHRIIDYRNVNKKNGVVMVSIDEKMLKHICTSSDGITEDVNNFNFIVDNKGYIVSYIEDDQLSKQILPEGIVQEDKKEAYIKFIKEMGVFGGEYFSVQVIQDEKYGWDIINVSDQSKNIHEISNQLKLYSITLAISFIILVIVILVLTERLTGSIKKVVEAMKKAGNGQLSVRAEMAEDMPMEIRTIAVQFNKMMDKVKNSVEKEIEANEKLRQSEIKALEAQINPHFLYNTLDTINWMAIDHDEYEISNAIGTLASILRYGINNSNGIVTIRDEVEWLKQYIHLQQTRLISLFQCDIHVEPDCMDLKIHKLLIQPFVENSIIHGFDGANQKYQLNIDIKEEDNFICISIRDNGKGMDSKLVTDMKNGIFAAVGDKNHIGMENAITRIKMYYGESADIVINSMLGKGTRVLIKIPRRA